MRRFRFALQKVHEFRRHQERTARLAMAEELTLLGHLEARRCQIEENIEACNAPTGTGVMKPLARAIEGGLLSVLRRVADGIEVAEERVAQARLVYQQQRRDLLALDKLRNRRFDSWSKDAAAEEQREFDEMARIRFVSEKRERASR